MTSHHLNQVGGNHSCCYDPCNLSLTLLVRYQSVQAGKTLQTLQALPAVSPQQVMEAEEAGLKRGSLCLLTASYKVRFF